MGNIPQQQHADAIQNFNVDKYSGKWFEISKFPLVWEQKCSSAVAMYKVTNNKTLEVTNICFAQDGTESFRRTGVARFADPKHTDAKLLLKFTDNLPSDGESEYWVLMTNYSDFAVVGNSQKTQLWILSRQMHMSRCLYNAILNELSHKFHYDTNKLELHSNALVYCPD